jgi:hypothetical protein
MNEVGVKPRRNRAGAVTGSKERSSANRCLRADADLRGFRGDERHVGARHSRAGRAETVDVVRRDDQRRQHRHTVRVHHGARNTDVRAGAGGDVRGAGGIRSALDLEREIARGVRGSGDLLAGEVSWSQEIWMSGQPEKSTMTVEPAMTLFAKSRMVTR